MLLLGRNLGESIVIDDHIYITFVETDRSGNKFKIAIDAPRDVKIARGELYEPGSEQHKRLAKVTAKKPRQKADAAEEPARLENPA